jgi:hypothetical protein
MLNACSVQVLATCSFLFNEFICLSKEKKKQKKESAMLDLERTIQNQHFQYH